MSITPSQISDKLTILCQASSARLNEILDDEFSFKPSPEKWSKKEILGHLIDSAANNHQRLVRAQFETPTVFYEQNQWANLQHYQTEDREIIINLWESYNRHLAHVIKHIPTENLKKLTIGRDNSKYTLEYVIEDYLNHLQHHLNQILN